MTNTFATVIGPGVIIRGSIHSNQDVIIHGEVEGDLDVKDCRLTIAPGGRALANTRAGEVDVQGTIKGDVNSRTTVYIRTGGELIGDIRTAGIIIEDGAVFRGGIDIVRTGAQEPAGKD